MRRPRLRIAGSRAMRRAGVGPPPPTRGLPVPHINRPSHTRAACSAHQPAIPHAGRLFRMWEGLPRLGIAGPRADEKAQAPHSGFARDAASRCRATSSYTRSACSAHQPAIPHAGRLFHTRAALPRLGIAGPRADEAATPRDTRDPPQQHNMSYHPDFFYTPPHTPL